MSDPNHVIFRKLLERYPDLEACAAEIFAAGELLKNAAAGGNKILLCGNGGSAADADHITGELLKSFCKKRPIDKKFKERLKDLDQDAGADLAEKLQGGIPAISLTFHNALSTAFGNDVDPNMAFAQQAFVYAKPGDVFWGISTSGNAKNVYNAALVAKAKGLKVLGMTAKGGGKLKQISDICIAVPRTETYEAQELHLPVYHALCLYVEDALW
ncbi:D-sedoheptulose-7-phosphate isomerase [Leadbettera azotonutricia]|uniref:Phosphoheptose isomerase n=1 Tax=Leadbettera azotonutricia (strain ATCC BAA-888 / DSM 13862 / ZAS-9) TaxID=545695 RepID=F5YD59_LEAAZ|nr:SIS domain-containing protein [Leadbettera azotonutricia]AEF82957.1 phosphoheptose isomerase [Leadbettera azotonutricia ZAS-9]